MRKNIWKWTALLVAAIVSVDFVSCGNDDVEENKPKPNNGGGSTPTSTLVGVWESLEGGSVMAFNADGTGYTYSTEGVIYGSFFTYKYDAKQQTIVFNDSAEASDTWTVSVLDDKNLYAVFELYAQNHDVKFVRRTDPAVSAEIVGTWKNMDGDATDVIVFRADGTGYWSENSGGATESATYKFVYDAKFHVAIVSYDNAGEKELWFLMDFDGKSFVLDGDQYVKQ